MIFYLAHIIRLLLSHIRLKHDARRTPLSSVDCPAGFCMPGRIDLRSRTGKSIRISCLWPVCLGVQFQLELFNFLHERVYCWWLFPSESWQSSFNASPCYARKLYADFGRTTWTIREMSWPHDIFIKLAVHLSPFSLILSSFLPFFFICYISRSECFILRNSKRYVTTWSYHSVTYHTYVTDLLWELFYDMFRYYSVNILLIKFFNI